MFCQTNIMPDSRYHRARFSTKRPYVSGVTVDDYGGEHDLQSIRTVSQAIVMTGHVLHPGIQNQRTYTFIITLI